MSEWAQHGPVAGQAVGDKTGFGISSAKAYTPTLERSGPLPLTVWHLTDNAIPISRSENCANVGCAEKAERDARASAPERDCHRECTTSDNTVSSVPPLTLAAEETAATKSRIGAT